MRLVSQREVPQSQNAGEGQGRRCCKTYIPTLRSYDARDKSEGNGGVEVGV